jgi:catechol 2,3-dioxygenase-like lactoylglutathione lyase family enzyme
MNSRGHIRQIDCTFVFARGMTAMRRFYGEVMEFPLLRILSERWIERRVSSNTLALVTHKPRFTGTPQEQGVLSLQLAFRVTPGVVADCAASLEAKGVALISPRTDHPFGHRTNFFRDPDANVLEIYAEV